MESDSTDKESSEQFSFPMSKREKCKHENLEKTITAILDDEEEFEISTQMNLKRSPTIEVKMLDPENEVHLDSVPRKSQSPGISQNTSGVPQAEEMLKTSEMKDNETLSAQSNRKKLSLLSSNYKPKERVFKKGKLKKPQSQKEPSTNTSNNLLGGFKAVSSFYVNKCYDTSMIMGAGTLTSINDVESSESSRMHSMNDAMTVSSGGDSLNRYPHNYYMPPPGFAPHPSMAPVHLNSQGYMNFMRSQTMHPHIMHSNALLEPRLSPDHTDPSQYSYQAPHLKPSNSPDHSKLNPAKPSKKGFRKVKSTNEKSMPIDPAARTLIMN